nr:chemosensory protein 1 [Ophraella communa]
MVPLICVIVAGLSGLVVAAPVPEDNEPYYTTKYDHVDVEMILNNRRLVNYYTACILNKGPCPPEGIEFKRILPDALKTNCRKCTEKQKVTTLHAIKRLMKEYKKIWKQLKAEWDPDDIYVTKFLETYSKPTDANIFSNRFDGEESSESESTKASTNSTTESSNFSSSTPTTLGIYLPPVPTLSPMVKPIANTIGQRLKSTVSFGGNIVGQVIKDIQRIGNTVVLTGAEIAGNIGNRVIQRGTQIAGALRAIANPAFRFNRT